MLLNVAIRILCLSYKLSKIKDPIQYKEITDTLKLWQVSVKVRFILFK